MILENILYTVPDEYVRGLLIEIEKAKRTGSRSIYRINDRMSRRVATYTKEFFSSNPEYDLDIKACARCTNKWDVIITWRNKNG